MHTRTAPRSTGLLLGLSASLALAMTAWFWITGAPLTTAAAPHGMISFELAGTMERSAAILASWDQQARRLALLHLRVDFLYMLAYGLAISLGCRWAGGRPGSKLRRLGLGLATGIWVAVLCDVGENIALLLLLQGPVVAPWPLVAALLAAVKFALVGVSLLFVLEAVIRTLVKFLDGRG